MQYEIRRNVLAGHSVLKITEAEFNGLDEAHKSLLAILAREQKYDIVIGNYISLEKQIFDCSINYVVRPSFKRTDFDRATVSIDRALANFLSSARGFIDQSKRKLLPADLCVIKKLYNSQYDSTLAYRTMEALRNHSQHGERLLTHTLAYKGLWAEKEKASRKLTHTVIPSLKTQELRLDKDFKVSVLEELESMKLEEHPIMPFIREYLGCLSTVHAQIRDQFSSRQNDWIGLLQKATANYCQHDKNSLEIGVVVVARNEDGSIHEEIHLGLELEERLETLQQANQRLVNLHLRQLTT